MSIEFNKVGYIYSEKTPFEYAALHDVDLKFSEGKITAIIGATGSGKSTLVQHLNALLLPSSGKLNVLNFEIVAKQKATNLKALRSHVGLVFQFPEYQLFEETILKDLCFGPKNFGATDEEAQEKAIRALKLVGLDQSYLEKSPLDLSGGQKRRVAIAGILAMDPDVLVLDEPTAGLDPQGAIAMMSLFKELNQKFGKTVLVVTHDMEHVLNYCDEVVVMKKGEVYRLPSPFYLSEQFATWASEFPEVGSIKATHQFLVPSTGEIIKCKCICENNVAYDEEQILYGNVCELYYFDHYFLHTRTICNFLHHKGTPVHASLKRYGELPSFHVKQLPQYHHPAC